MPKKLQLLVPLVGPEGPQGPKGETGSAGKDGATFKPSVTEDGVLSWTNDKGLANPTPVAIKNSGIHIGAEEPTNPNANIWIFPDEEAEEPTDDTVYIPAPETAEVGQTIVVKAVDENGKPTEWEATDFPVVDIPSAGGSSGWELLTTITTTEAVTTLKIDTDANGVDFADKNLTELTAYLKVPAIPDLTTAEKLIVNFGFHSKHTDASGLAKVLSSSENHARVYVKALGDGAIMVCNVMNVITEKYVNCSSGPIECKTLSELMFISTSSSIPVGTIVKVYGRS